MTRLSEDLVARLERLAMSEGLELLAVEVGGTARKPVVRFVLDRQQGGVSLPGAFTLEVSSPGVERKLYKANDFTRFMGRAVRVRMRPSWPAPRVIEGALEGRADGVIRVRDRAGATRELPEPEVFETRLAPHLEEDEKKPKHRGRT